MAEYIYRATAKTVRLADGRMAYVAKFAYKPYGWRGDINAKMHFRSGCTASENMTLKSDLLVTLSEDGRTGTLYDNTSRMTVFSDYAFGTERMAKLADIELRDKRYVLAR